MQLKLLNFHKILSNFATNIVGAFVALIIYQACGSFVYSFLWLVGDHSLRVIYNISFYKFYTRYPQLALALRVVPVLVSTLSILLLDVNLILGIILILFFHPMTIAFKELPMEITFNYSSLDKGTSSTGISRMFEQLGVVIALIMGGLFLDYLERYIVIIIAVASYLISVVPLLIYYFRQRKSTYFNKEAISNAATGYSNIVIKQQMKKRTIKKLVFNYAVIYFIFAVFDSLMNITMLYMFYSGSEAYSYAGYIQAAFYGFFGFGGYVAGVLDEKKDTTKLVCIFSILAGVVAALVPLVIKNIVLCVAAFAVIGFLYAFTSLFCYSRMMPRARIMGCSNLALWGRTAGCHISMVMMDLVCLPGSFMFIPAFIVMGVFFASSAFFIPRNEEKTREFLVDYLQNNNLY